MTPDKLLTFCLLLSLPGSAVATNDQPDAALLEFLAEWELDSGDWVAPEDIARLDIAEKQPRDPASGKEDEDDDEN